MQQLKTICVYCGSSTGKHAVYRYAARQLAEDLVSREIGLVYGGASIGIMGAIADQVLALGGRVTGVIPQALSHQEVVHPNLTELHITRTMHERKMLMAELADGFIALPGGIGTLEELFEIWTWAQLGFHNKPIGLLNVAGYYDDLLKFLTHMHQEQFFKSRHRELLLVENSSSDLLARFSDYQLPTLPQDGLHKEDLA